MSFDWPYYVLYAGKLYIKTRQGLLEAFPVTGPSRRFETATDAEAWLVENDIRGNVMESQSKF